MPLGQRRLVGRPTLRRGARRQCAPPASPGSHPRAPPPRAAARRLARDPSPRRARGAARARAGSSTSSSKRARTAAQRPSPAAHDAASAVLSSWKRNARAVCQWRFTVRTERPEMVRDLVHRQPGEEAPLDEPGELLVHGAEPVERLVERHELRRALLDRDVGGVEIERPQAGAAPAAHAGTRRGRSGSCASRGPRSRRSASGRGPTRRAPRELQVRLVDERGRRERPLGGRLPELPVGDRAQLAVEDRKEPVHGLPVARLGGAQDRRDLGRRGRIRSPRRRRRPAGRSWLWGQHFSGGPPPPWCVRARPGSVALFGRFRRVTDRRPLRRPGGPTWRSAPRPSPLAWLVLFAAAGRPRRRRHLHRHEHRRTRAPARSARRSPTPTATRARTTSHFNIPGTGVQTIAPATRAAEDHRRRHDRRLHAAGRLREHQRRRTRD